ncbi:MAG: type II secretion system protein GspN [Candidatus Firestonebacteria bacterium]|nr:type II secretion system protein GspN [Candidatus Firestonebacteria bacterium]
MKKIILIISIILTVILLAILVLLYKLPYKKYIDNIASSYNYKVETQEIAYSPISNLLIKNMIITSAAGSLQPILQTQEIILRFDLLPLLIGNLNSTIKINAYEGTIITKNNYDLVNDSLKKVTVIFDKINIDEYPLIRQNSICNIKGLLSGKIIINHKDNVYKSDGNIIISGPVKVYELEYNGAEFPYLEFDNITIQFTFENGTIIIKNFICDGNVILAKGNGNIELKDPVNKSNISITLWLGPALNSPMELKNLMALLCGLNGPKDGIKFKLQGELDALEFIPLQ